MKNIYQRKIQENPDLTAFQKKVLIATLGIPSGKVKSYLWVAKKAGSAKAARAVGRVMAMNPYSPYVPCHRVISSSGKIGGYSGGLRKKRKLLKEEGVII